MNGARDFDTNGYCVFYEAKAKGDVPFKHSTPLAESLHEPYPAAHGHFILSHIILEACKFIIAVNLWRFIEWWTSRNGYKDLIAHFQTRSGREQRH
jgi:hypothetical protein